MRHRELVCPFCALLCDDLVVEAAPGGLTVVENGCARARTMFAQPAAAAQPTAHGVAVSIEQAIERAAGLLAGSRLVLFSGPGADVDGARAMLSLADRLGGVVDPAGSTALFAGMFAMQRIGWVTATLAEIRNRADLLLFFGTDGRSVAPRLEERVLAAEPLPGTPAAAGRRRIAIGAGIEVPGASLRLLCPPDRLHEVAAVLRARVERRRITAAEVAGIPLAAIDAVADALRGARYAAVLWHAAEMPAAVAELAIASLAGMLLALNRQTRAVGLPLAAGPAATTANQVCTWQTGSPVRTAFTSDGPDYDPRGFAGTVLVEEGGVDAVVWLAAFERCAPPSAEVPTVALVAPGEAPVAAEVMIPVGVPGLDHPGTAFRGDGVVALPLRAPRGLSLPPAASVLRAIEAALPRR